MEQPAVRAGWELVHLHEESVRRLEDMATRVVAALLAGLIALWTQLFTFEEALPASLAWLAWSLLVLAIGFLGGRITPRRLSSFLRRLDESSSVALAELTEADEVELARDLAESLRALRERIHRGVRVSAVLGLAALAAVVLAYALDKAVYGG